MKELIILPGTDKKGQKEHFDSISFHLGELWAIVGPTGSGKSRFIKDIEMLVSGDSVTGRHVLIDGRALSKDEKYPVMESLIAHLGQNMRFILDLSVGDFLSFHGEANGNADDDKTKIIAAASCISGEPFELTASLSELSGGQSRALMVADIAYLSDRPIVLIDEIENAGIDKTAALGLLIRKGKLVLLVTHDPHTALIADFRIAIREGAVASVRRKSSRETDQFRILDEIYRKEQQLRQKMRNGEELIW